MGCGTQLRSIGVIFSTLVHALFGEQQPFQCWLPSQSDFQGNVLLAKSITLQLSNVHSVSEDFESQRVSERADVKTESNTLKSHSGFSGKSMTISSPAFHGDDAVTSPSKNDVNRSKLGVIDQQGSQRRPRARAKKASKKMPRRVQDEPADDAIDKDNPPWMRRRERLPDNGVAWMQHNPEMVSCAFWFTMYTCTMAFFCCTESRRKKRNAAARAGAEDSHTPTSSACDQYSSHPFDEDIYGLAVGLLIKDAHTVGICDDSARKQLYWSRIIGHTGVLYLTITFQIFLLLQINRYVTPSAIDSIRFVYSEYEWRMHGSNISNGDLITPNLYVGKPEFFDRNHFKDLRKDLKKDVCHVPFSQPFFFVSIIFLWTLTCAHELRKTSEVFDQFVVTLPVLDSSTIDEEEHISAIGTAKLYDNGSTLQVQSLSRRLKALILVFILLPRFCVATSLLWIGCRWLAATTDFGDLILNTMALEFILLLKDLVYFAMVPNTAKHNLAGMEVRLQAPAEGYRSFFGTFLWGVAALAWALMYIFRLQQVLPGYRWDVGKLCGEYLRYGEQPAAAIALFSTF